MHSSLVFRIPFPELSTRIDPTPLAGTQWGLSRWSLKGGVRLNRTNVRQTVTAVFYSVSFGMTVSRCYLGVHLLLLNKTQLRIPCWGNGKELRGIKSDMKTFLVFKNFVLVSSMCWRQVRHWIQLRLLAHNRVSAACH